MSIVVGLKDKDGVCWLACDKQITVGSRRATMAEGYNKIFDVADREGCMMGHVGYLRGINLLETNNTYFDELAYYRHSLDYTYMVNSFVPLVDTLFRDSGFTDADATVIDLKGETLVVADNEMYEVGGDGSVMVIDNYSAIGSGSEMAMGSLSSTEDLEAQDRLVEAIKAANQNIYCGCSGIMMNNKDSKIYQFEF